MAADPVSRLGSFEPGDKTGLRLSPHLAPSTCLACIAIRVRLTQKQKLVGVGLFRRRRRCCRALLGADRESRPCHRWQRPR